MKKPYKIIIVIIVIILASFLTSCGSSWSCKKRYVNKDFNQQNRTQKNILNS